MTLVFGPVRLRVYREGDAPALCALYVASVRGIGPGDYSAEQVEAWASLAPSAEALHRRCMDGRSVVVAVDADDQPLAFGDIEPDGHIGYLYCRPDAAGQGVTAGVYAALEVQARGAGLERIYVEASEAARRFFLRLGFREGERRSFSIRGVPIHNYALEKALTATP